MERNLSRYSLVDTEFRIKNGAVGIGRALLSKIEWFNIW